MTDHSHAIPLRSGLAASALAAAGALFVLYPALRPFSDEVTLEGASAFASVSWIVSHSAAIVAFTLLTVGLWGLYAALRSSAAERLAFQGMLYAWIGTGLTLPFYGAETFGLHAIGRFAVGQRSADVMSLAEDIRFGIGLAMIAIGLLILAVGSILLAAAIWKSGMLARWSGIPFAVGIALYLPQYAAGQPLRVAHGLVLAIGCCWIAYGLRNVRSRPKQLEEAA